MLFQSLLVMVDMNFILLRRSMFAAVSREAKIVYTDLYSISQFSILIRLYIKMYKFNLISFRLQGHY
jgi:hypothetical protein